jgi:hypothetical protein
MSEEAVLCTQCGWHQALMRFMATDRPELDPAPRRTIPILSNVIASRGLIGFLLLVGLWVLVTWGAWVRWKGYNHECYRWAQRTGAERRLMGRWESTHSDATLIFEPETLATASSDPDARRHWLWTIMYRSTKREDQAGVPLRSAIRRHGSDSIVLVLLAAASPATQPADPYAGPSFAAGRKTVVVPKDEPIPVEQLGADVAPAGELVELGPVLFGVDELEINGLPGEAGPSRWRQVERLEQDFQSDFFLFALFAFISVLLLGIIAKLAYLRLIGA